MAHRSKVHSPPYCQGVLVGECLGANRPGAEGHHRRSDIVVACLALPILLPPPLNPLADGGPTHCSKSGSLNTIFLCFYNLKFAFIFGTHI